VRSASLARESLLTGGGWADNRVAVDDRPMPVEDLSSNRLWRNAITPGWFETMGTPLVNGRDFTGADRVGAPPVAIVNEAFVRRYQLSGQPIGRTVRIGLSTGERRYDIVGVVADSTYTSPRDGMLATMYVPLAQLEPAAIGETLALTINGDRSRRAAVEREVAAALARTEPGLAFVFRTFDQFIDATVTQERLVAMLSSFFGALALLLAGIGLYGIVAQAVRTSQGEIGLRLALGAEPAGIVRLVFRRVGVLIVIGLVIGVAGSLWAAQFVGPLLFQVEARDPATFAGAAGVLTAAGVLAAWLPARRAARLDPATILREG
jgi:ABC-type antimicrobial peptide transport system permease subunit